MLISRHDLKLDINESAKSHQTLKPTQSKKVTLFEIVIASSQWFIYSAISNHVKYHWCVSHRERAESPIIVAGKSRRIS